MWVPKTLLIKNIGSHKETLYHFLNGETRIIYGVNIDDYPKDKPGSNGSGKSILTESIHINITGDPLRKARLVDILRDGEDKGFISFTLYNTRLKKELIIDRIIWRTKSQEVSLLLDNELEKHSGVTEYNNRILELFDIRKEDLSNYFIVHKDKFISFFSATDSKQKEIVSRFSGTDLLKGIDKLVEEDANDIATEIEESEKSLIAVNATIDVYKTQIEEIDLKDLEKEKNAALDIINKEIDKLREDNLNLSQSILSLESNILEFNKENDTLLLSIEEGKKTVKELEGVEFNIKEIELKSSEKTEIDLLELNIGKKIKENRLSLNENLNKLSNIEKSLLGIITCPKCEHKFSLQEKNLDIEATTQLKDVVASIIKNKEEFIIDANVDLSTLAKNREEINTQIKELEKQDEQKQKQIKFAKETVSKIEDKLNDNRKKIDYIKFSDIVRIRKTITTNEELVDQYTLNAFNKRMEVKTKEELKAPLEDKIKNIEINKNTLGEVIKKKKDDRSEILEWNFLFKRFQNYLVNQAVKSIEGYTNYYLEVFDTNLSVIIEGNRLLADGKTMREEIECNVLRNGIKQGLFGRYSSGERTKISIAGILALQRLINLNSKSGGLDLLILDEIIESVDSVGVDYIVNALSKVHQTIELITHTTNNIVGINQIGFIKSNGETKIIEL